jgi:large repetitive protein
MKFKKYLLICVFIVLNHYVSFAQLITPFAPRLPGGNISIKGDVVFVGNNIVNRTESRPTGFNANGEPINLAALTAEANTAYNVDANNNGQNMEYIDIDGDNSTFSSSSADLAIGTEPDGTINLPLQQCKKIVYAGLYWTAAYIYDRAGLNGAGNPSTTIGTPIKNDWNQIKFKIPGGNYIDIIADAAADPVGDEDEIILSPTRTPNVYNRPYVCYKNVTTLLRSLANPNGSYFVANQRAARGVNPNGNSGGWSLVVVYESPTLTSKFISTFDGFANINSGSLTDVDFNINGFQTIPVGPVRAKIGVSALEGDTSLFGDNLRFKANSRPTFSTIFNALNLNNNFFNGTISNNNFNVTNRLPNSGNTLGFDLDILNLNNPLNGTLPNNETGGTLRLTTNSDSYGAYLTTFAVDVIAPDVQLTKQVKNLNNVSIEGQEVKLCEDLLYVVGFQNIGNDNVRNLVIRDVLPINITFNPATDLTLPLGVTLASYDPGSRELIFNVDNDLVKVGDPRYEITIKVKIVCNCIDLDDACANEIKNQAFATYTGTINTNIFSNEGSIASFGNCNIGNPTSTNFLVGIDPSACSFTRDVILCSNTVQLTAANGYTSYQWTGPAGATFTPNANSQTVTVNLPGTYTVSNVINQSPCKNITETFNVINFNGGAGLTNPIIPYNENLPATVCPNNGVVVPFIFLCGASDNQLLATNVVGSTSVVWEKLNPACLTTSAPGSQGDITSTLWNPLCPREGLPNTCWIAQPSVAGSPGDYLANAPGEYRVTYTFQGNCTRTFYFNVYQNLLAPTFTKKDVVCNSLGEITIGNVPVTTPASYNYTLVPGNTTSANPNTTGVFVGIPAGVYDVVVTQIGVVDGCKFTLPGIPIINRNVTVQSTVVDALCFEDKGTITLAINNANPQYNFSLFNAAGTLVASSLLINANTYTFPAQFPGTYTYTVTSSAPDSCNLTGTATIRSTPQLFVNAGITKPILPCSDGEITFNGSGGTAPYNYTVNGATAGGNTFPVPSPGGTYDICAVDFNNCKACTKITIAPNPPPVFTITQTNILCAGTNSGAININVTNANGFQILTSITGAAPFNNVFNYTTLAAGTYQVVLQYGLNGVFCTTPPQVITITEPSNPLTASGGVSQVACLSNGGNGTIRITNPQGGTGPYQYNLGLGYFTLPNERDVPPGTYTISIRDANLCEFFMTVTVAPIPTAPTITVGPPVYACDGSASTSVTVLNPAGTNYTYQYLIDTPLTPPHDPNSNVFTNIPCGPRVITVNSTLISPPTFSELLKEDFGRGPDTTSPGIAAAYCFNNQPYPPGQPCGNNPIPGFPRPNCRERGNDSWYLDDNQYVVTSDLNPNNCNWFDYRDHTSNGTDSAGRFLAVNIGFAAGPNGVLYSKVINSVIPNQPLQIELYLANLLKKGVGGVDPDFLIEIVAPNGTVLGRQLVGVIDNQDDVWQLKTLSLNPGNNTTLTFNIRSGSTQYDGNDAGIDDIRVYQLPVSCTNSTQFPINIPCDQAFNAQIVGSTQPTCAGANDATVTLSVTNFNTTTGYQVSLNNGTTWIPYTVSPTTITLPAGYTSGPILVRYDASTPPNPKCNFSLPFVIIQPTPIVVTATPTPATCITGGTITASAIGGTGAYQYQLVTVPGGAIIFPYQASNIFNNVAPGIYNVVVRDVNNCTGTTATPVVIQAPTVPIVTITSASCITATTLSTIVVNATGGTGTYTYYIDNVVNTPPGSNTFTNVAVGTHVIYVIDSNGCRSAPVTQIIAPALVATGSILKPLDCTASPNAIIQGAINGGTAPFTYTVNAGASVAITGTIFTYSAISGTYTFVVTDAAGCTSTFTQTIAPITNPTVTVTVGPDINCAGDSTGSLNIVPAGGLPGYTIVVVRTAPTTQTYNGPGPLFDGLPAGNYTVTVTDANSCQVIQNVTIIEKPAIAFTPTKTDKACTPTGIVLGTISSGIITGGTSPYNVTLSNSTSGSNPVTLATPGASVTFPNLIPGIYTLQVVDANNCKSVLQTVNLNEVVNGLVINTSVIAPDCSTGPRIIVTVANPVVGNTYLFGIANGSNVAPFTDALLPSDPGIYDQHTFNVTANQNYTFVVFDTNSNCYFFQTALTGAPPTSNMTAVINTINCTPTTPPNNVNPIQFTVSGYNPVTTSIVYNIFIAGTNTQVATGVLTVPGMLTSPLITLPFAGNFYIQLIEQNTTNPALNGCSTGTPNFTTTSAPLIPLSLRVVTNVNANCNQPNAIVTLQGIGGGGPVYTFAAVPTGTPLGVTPFGPSPLNLPAGSWDVYVKDATGCTTSIPVTTVFDPLPTVTLGVLDQCTSTGTYSFNVVGTGLAQLTYAIYSFNGTLVTPQVFQSNNFVVTAPGTYVIIVKDKNGCTALSTPIVIAPPIVATASFTTLPICNNPNGVITVVASGGSGVGFTYAINPVPPGSTQAGNVFSNIPPGNYVITVTDTQTNCTKLIDVKLGQATDPVFSLLPALTACIGDSNGTITVNLSAPPANVDFDYTYTITAGPAAFPTPVTLPVGTNVFTGLPTGNYTVEVVSARGCRFSQTTRVDEPAPIFIPPPTVVQFNCTAGSNITNLASITVNGVTGGNGAPYNYEFLLGTTIVQPYSPINVLNVTNLAGGTYTINVKDNKGCIYSVTAVINPFSRISAPVVAVTAPITCTTPESIAVTVTINGPVVPLNYTISAIAPTPPLNQTNNTGVFTGLVVGSYNIVISNPLTGCSLTVAHTVSDPNTFILTVAKVTDVICKGGSDGSVNLTISDTLPPDQSGPFTYTVTNNTAVPPLVITGTSPTAGPTLVTGLTAGTYTASVTLTNSPFCTTTSSFTIIEPGIPLSVVTTSTEITCITQGTITAVATGGWQGAYQYQLLLGGNAVGGFSTTNVFTGLNPGSYTVQVRDINGCIAVSTPPIVLVVPAPITATITPTPINCKDDTTTLTISNITGGQGSNYSYILSGPIPANISGPQSITSNPFIISGLIAGTYSIDIIDGWGCKATFPINITEPTKVVATLTTRTSPTCTTGAILTLTASGGTPPYTYDTSITGPFNPPTFNPSTDITLAVNASGSFSYYVKDAQGCISLVSNTVKVEPVKPTRIKTLIKQDIKCGGDLTGQINVVAEDGLGNYQYTLLNGANAVIAGPQATGLFTGLGVGTYFVQVTGNGGCRITTPPITITEPPVFRVTLTPNPVKCFGGRDGSITINTTNGLGVIVYSIDPPAAQAFVVISNPANTSTTLNPPITYTIQDLQAGTYQVLVQDQNGCFYRETITINEPTTAVSGQVNDTDILDELCFGDNNGQFTVTNIGGGIGGPYTISLYLDSLNNTPLVADAPINNSAGANTHIFTLLGGGNYIVVIKDANACRKDLEVTIKDGIDMEPKAILTYPCVDNKPSVKIEVVNNSSADGSFDPIVDYTFVLTQIGPPASTSAPQVGNNVFTSVTHPQLLTPGGFSVTVTNVNTCEKVSDVVTVTADNLVPLTLTLDQGGLNQIVATATGGSGGYTYTFNGEYTGSNNVYVYYYSGIYTVVVTDSSGCTAEAKKEFIFIPIVIPDFFTPNGDGTNSTWTPLNTSNYKNLKTFIYDRYGRKLREMNEGEKWDGTYEGKEVPSGDYWYVVKVNDPKNDQEFVGHFTLYR